LQDRYRSGFLESMNLEEQSSSMAKKALSIGSAGEAERNAITSRFPV